MPVRSPEKRKASRPLDLAVWQARGENSRGDDDGNGNGDGSPSASGNDGESRGGLVAKRARLERLSDLI